MTADDIQEALSKNMFKVHRSITSKIPELAILADTDLQTAEQFDNLVLKNEKGYLVRLKDIGHAELGPTSERVSAIIGGKRTL